MSYFPTIFVLLTIFTSAILTFWVKRSALKRGLLDRPNARSSHSQPTPRGGGLSIFVSTTAGIVVLFLYDFIDLSLCAAMIVGGGVVAAVGYLDDRGKASVRWRFAVHFAAAIFALYVLGGLPALQVGHDVIDPGWMGNVVGVIAIVWALNLFNFMDGIDGIAASEAVFVTGAAAFLTSMSGSLTVPSSVSLVTAAASFGFLLWNWPPAKIFMGDVGSGYLGYVIAILAIASGRQSPVFLHVWLILGGVFFVDATVTLIRRLLRRERVYQAHRSHAYQWLSRRWQSHLRVTLAVWMVNLVWLLPWAWLCTRYPERALVFVGVSLAPLVFVALLAGAGRTESTSNS